MENILAWLVIGGLISIPILNTVAATITRYAKKKSGKKIDIIPYPVVDYSEKTWFELEQAYAEYIKIGWYGGLRGVEWARFNILYKEKRYRQAVEHALEAMYLEINGSDASYDYQFDNIKKTICFSDKEWENTKDTVFCLFGNVGRAIAQAKITEQELVDMFINSRVRLPFAIQRQECIKHICKNYKKLQTDYTKQ